MPLDRQVPVNPESVEEDQCGTSRALLNQPDVFSTSTKSSKRAGPYASERNLGRSANDCFNLIDAIDRTGLTVVVGKKVTPTATEAYVRAFDRPRVAQDLACHKGYWPISVYFDAGSKRT